MMSCARALAAKLPSRCLPVSFQRPLGERTKNQRDVEVGARTSDEVDFHQQGAVTSFSFQKDPKSVPEVNHCKFFLGWNMTHTGLFDLTFF